MGNGKLLHSRGSLGVCSLWRVARCTGAPRRGIATGVQKITESWALPVHRMAGWRIVVHGRRKRGRPVRPARDRSVLRFRSFAALGSVAEFDTLLPAIVALSGRSLMSARAFRAYALGRYAGTSESLQ